MNQRKSINKEMYVRKINRIRCRLDKEEPSMTHRYKSNDSKLMGVTETKRREPLLLRET